MYAKLDFDQLPENSPISSSSEEMVWGEDEEESFNKNVGKDLELVSCSEAERLKDEESMVVKNHDHLLF